jgi:signal transduction histidine kinase
MEHIGWQSLKKITRFIVTDPPDPEEQSMRIRFMERNIGLVVRLVVILVLFYYLFYSNWFDPTTVIQEVQEVALELVQRFFLIYALLSLAAGIMLWGMDQLPLKFIRWVVFTMALIDGIFLAALTLVTGGFDSILFWIFLGLIVRNAISIPVAPLQILINLIISGSYVMAGLQDVVIRNYDVPFGDPEPMAEPFFLRLTLLLLLTVCCYGVQVLLDKQRKAAEESREFVLRQEQLRVTGRLAAEIAHQLKNPLGIINNAAFNLQRNVKEGKATITQQIRIIREEVERSDRIITDLMGYARLADGRLEKLNANEELDRALNEVFPLPVNYDIVVHRDYQPELPPLLMQRNHASEIFVNILLNAREILNGKGNIYVSTRQDEDYAILVTVGDDGPGVPMELRERIFEPYFTTKTKGTGLGLAIVKHNVELYGGTVRVESETGKGARFVLVLPAKSITKIKK